MVTVAVETIPEGVLLRRTVSLRNAASPPRWRRVSGTSNILIHNACLYYLEDSPLYRFGYGWDGARDDLGAGFRRDLAAGEALPDVCLPLRPGQTWGNPNQSRRLWTVAGFGPKNADDPPSLPAQSWRLEAHLASGDDNYVWFQQGVGVIAARTFHNGTYHDERIRLLRFEPANRRR